VRYAAETVGFWDAFWPTLAAGVIASLLTGLIVGLAIWRVQQASDERRYEHEARREFARFRRRLVQGLVQPDLETIVIGRAVNSARRATELATFIESQPIDEWRETLEDERGLLDLLTSVVEGHAVFTAAAGELDYALQAAIRAHNATAGLSESNDSADRAYFVGVIAGFTPEVTLSWIDLPPSARPRFDRSFAALQSDQNVAARVVPYKTTRSELVAWLRALRRALGISRLS
jgi:hypothetical protein